MMTPCKNNLWKGNQFQPLINSEYLKIIPRVVIGYEMVDGAMCLIGY